MDTLQQSVMDNAQKVLAQVRKAVVGKDEALLWVLAAILAKGHILLEEVSRFAASSCNRAVKRGSLGVHSVCKADGVGRLVERVAWVICHTAVHRNVVLISGDSFDSSCGVECNACVCHDASAGFHTDSGHINAELLSIRLHMSRNELYVGRNIYRRIGVAVAHAISAADIKLTGDKAVFFLHKCNEIKHNIACA